MEYELPQLTINLQAFSVPEGSIALYLNSYYISFPYGGLQESPNLTVFPNSFCQLI